MAESCVRSRLASRSPRLTLAERRGGREDEEEAKLRAFYAQPGMACSLDLEEGWRWSYQRGLALGWERSHSGPRSAGTPEEPQAKIDAALAVMRRAS